MQEQKFRELEDRAAAYEPADSWKQLEARARINAEIATMRAKGEAFELSHEEIKMLDSFRRFKLRMRKRVETFTWQTGVPDGVALVKESGLIEHPDEVGDLSI